MGSTQAFSPSPYLAVLTSSPYLPSLHALSECQRARRALHLHTPYAAWLISRQLSSHFRQAAAQERHCSSSCFSHSVAHLAQASAHRAQATFEPLNMTSRHCWHSMLQASHSRMHSSMPSIPRHAFAHARHVVEHAVQFSMQSCISILCPSRRRPPPT
jgi:hypothetical protein